jgi:predicted transcriptional regulator
MAMTLRLSRELDEALRAAAAEDHRSVHQEVAHAVEAYLAQRETEEIKSDPETLRALAEARESTRAGNVVFGTEAARDLIRDRQAS